MHTASIVLGVLASLASITSFTPQAWRIIQTRDTSSLSAPMYAITVAGFGLWTGYGISLGQWPIIVTNTICFLLAGFILVMKLLPAHKKHEVADALDPTK